MNVQYHRADVGGAAGFTMLEMLVVLVILGILMVVIPRVDGSSSAVQLQAAAQSLAADLRLLHDDAVRRHQVTAMTLTQHPYSLRLADRPIILPRGIVATLEQEQPTLLAGVQDRVGFFPDGSSSGGNVTLQQGRRRVTILVRWLDGMVVVRG
jgi:general secretion pathway protein H